MEINSKPFYNPKDCCLIIEYPHWFAFQAIIQETTAILGYIRDNRQAIEMLLEYETQTLPDETCEFILSLDDFDYVGPYESRRDEYLTTIDPRSKVPMKSKIGFAILKEISFISTDNIIYSGEDYLHRLRHLVNLINDVFNSIHNDKVIRYFAEQAGIIINMTSYSSLRVIYDYYSGNAEAIPACSQHGTGGPIGLPAPIKPNYLELDPKIEITDKSDKVAEFATHRLDGTSICDTLESCYQQALEFYPDAKRTAHLVILDTIPDKAWDTIHQQMDNKPWSDNPFLNRFFNKNNLRQNEGGLVDILPMPDVNVSIDEWDNEDFSYHGVAVASIAYQLAPKAKIRLYQSLNKFGVTPLSRIYKTMKKVKEDALNGLFGNGPLIINCSFVLSSELDLTKDKQCLEGFVWDSNLIFINQLFRAWCVGISEALALHDPSPLDTARFSRLFVTAAAGNDNNFNKISSSDCEHDLYPMPRMPALTEGVIGVAALSSGSPRDLAYYSNLDDRPSYEGLATFGGEFNPRDKGRFASDKGIVGVYLQDNFPVGTNITTVPNHVGFAYMAGTSFAAPVVAGALALFTAVEGQTPKENHSFPKADELIFSGSSMAPPGLQGIEINQKINNQSREDS